MAETRWIVAILPGGELWESQRENGWRLELTVDSDDPEVVATVEAAAERNGMTIYRTAEV